MALSQVCSSVLASPARGAKLATPTLSRASAPSGRKRTCTIVASRNFNYKTRDTERAVSSEAKATTNELQIKAEEYLEQAKQRWEKVEDKPVAVAIGITALIVVWAASGLVDRIDKLPLVGGLLELVGLLVTAWFVYRYLVFGPDRDELKENLDKFLSKVTGESNTVDKFKNKIQDGL